MNEIVKGMLEHSPKNGKSIQTLRQKQTHDKNSQRKIIMRTKLTNTVFIRRRRSYMDQVERRKFQWKFNKLLRCFASASHLFVVRRENCEKSDTRHKYISMRTKSKIKKKTKRIKRVNQMSAHLKCISSNFRLESAYVCRQIISFTHLINRFIWLCAFLITRGKRAKAIVRSNTTSAYSPMPSFDLKCEFDKL